MIFKDKSGKLCFTMHYPNSTEGAERPKIFELAETEEEPYLKIL